METIDVEKIMQEIRDNIKKNGYTEDMLSFEDIKADNVILDEYNEGEFATVLHNLSVCAYVPWYRDLFSSKPKRLIQKIIRKLSAFLIAPITEQQSQYNKEVRKAFGQLAGYIENCDCQMEEHLKVIEILEAKIEKLEAEVKLLREGLK